MITIKIKVSTAHETEMHQSYLIGVLLAAAGGFIDAYTYITRGSVFAYAQTGNIVLLGINIGKGDFSRSLSYIIPIVTFILGIFIVEWLKKRFTPRQKNWRQMVIAIEALIVLAVCFIPYGKSTNPLAIILISLVSALQYESFHNLRGKAFASTMCTGNLRSGSENLYLFFETRDKYYRNKAIQYFGIIFVFILGAILGTELSGFFELKAALFSLIFLAGAFIALFFDKSFI